MAYALNQLLAAQVLTGLIQTTKPGLPQPLNPAFYSLVDKVVPSNYGTYTQYANTRKTMRMGQYGAPSKARDLEPIATKSVTLITGSENILLNQNDYMALRGWTDPNVQNLGADEVKRQIVEAKQYLENLRVAVTQSALMTGYVYTDSSGNLENSSSTGNTVDYGVPSGNKTHVGGTIVDWETSSTDIVKQLLDLKNLALRTTGYPLTTVVYGTSVPGYLSRNDSVKNYIRGNPGLASGFYGGAIPDGFCGLKWVDGSSMFYEKDDGSFAQWVGTDTCNFYPDPDPSWWGNLIGTTAVCTDLGGVNMGADSPQDNIIGAKGQFAYAVKSTDPVTIKVVYGDNFLPVLKVPAAVYLTDVSGS